MDVKLCCSVWAMCGCTSSLSMTFFFKCVCTYLLYERLCVSCRIQSSETEMTVGLGCPSSDSTSKMLGWETKMTAELYITWLC